MGSYVLSQSRNKPQKQPPKQKQISSISFLLLAQIFGICGSVYAIYIVLPSTTDIITAFPPFYCSLTSIVDAQPLLSSSNTSQQITQVPTQRSPAMFTLPLWTAATLQ